jgi:cytochrome c oxidase assembly protein subunit 15
MRDRLNVSPRRYHQIATAALVLLTVIVFTGAAVRVTGSGLGCPSWPKCSRTGLYNPSGIHGLIEFSNRMFTFPVSLAAFAAAFFSFFRVPRRTDLCVLGVLLPLGVVCQAVLGGLTVLYELRPGFVMGHYGLSILIIAVAWALYWRSKPGYAAGAIAPGARDRLTMWAARLLLGLGALTVVAGTAASAAGPHGGGKGTHDLIKRLYVKGPDTLDWAVTNHGTVAAILGVATLVALAIAYARDATTKLLAALATVAVLLALQGGLGIIQYSLKLPTGLVWTHVVMATCTWVALLWVWSAAGTPVGAPAAEPTVASASPPRASAATPSR